jgi:DNA-directed RNA polymerase specialized sigma24 family protein
VVVENTAADVARAVHSLSDADLVRLKALARLWARGMPRGLSWSDILHDAIVRALDGSRKWPAGVSLLAFLSGVMRSICADTWRREQLDADFAVLCPPAMEPNPPLTQSAWLVRLKAWRPSTRCSPATTPR